MQLVMGFLSPCFPEWETVKSGMIAMIPNLLYTQAPRGVLLEVGNGGFPNPCFSSGHPHAGRKGKAEPGIGTQFGYQVSTESMQATV